MFSSDQFELPCSRMFLPLNVGSSIVWPSEKSLIQPTFGQTATFAPGVLQYRVYIVFVFTWRSLTLNPSFSKFSLATSAAFAPTPSFVPTIRIGGPLYLPDEKPAFLKYEAARSRVGAPSLDRKSLPGPSIPPAWSKPASPGGR